ncbi:MAG: hydroxymethylglutaryl-CoA lyase, partial [Pseudomonadota bacterium]
MRDGVDVHLCEVGLRDGLQNIQTFFPTDQKLAWIEAEAAAGMPEIEVCSFVPPKLLPQFKDAADVCERALSIAKAHDGLVVSALMPNLKGAENGIAAGVHKLNYVTSVSEQHNMANVRRTTDESVAAFREIVALRDSKAQETGHRVRLLAGLATAFGCTIEGKVDPAAVLRLAEKFLDAGADELSVADTVGYANPAQIKSLLKS